MSTTWFNRMQRWPMLLVGQFLGTRSETDEQAKFLRERVREELILRAESTALALLLLEKGVVTKAEYDAAVERAAEGICRQLMERFPGVRPSAIGLEITDARKLHEVTKTWPK